MGFRDDVDDDNNDAVVSDRTFSIAKKTWKILVKICVFEDFGLDRLCPHFLKLYGPRLGPKLLAPSWSELAEIGASLAMRGWAGPICSFGAGGFLRQGSNVPP